MVSEKQELGWRVSVLPIPAFHCIYTVYIISRSGGMQEWVIQIPSIPILVSASLHLKYFRIKFLLLVIQNSLVVNCGDLLPKHARGQTRCYFHKWTTVQILQCCVAKILQRSVHSGGMQDWVIQIPSIPFLVSVVFPYVHALFFLQVMIDFFLFSVCRIIFDSNTCS